MQYKQRKKKNCMLESIKSKSPTEKKLQIKARNITCKNGKFSEKNEN